MKLQESTPEGEWLVDQEYVRTEYVLHKYLKYWYVLLCHSGENAADTSMKTMSWEAADVVVFAIGGDARDVVTVGIKSDLMGSVYSTAVT